MADYTLNFASLATANPYVLSSPLLFMYGGTSAANAYQIVNGSGIKIGSYGSTGQSWGVHNASYGNLITSEITVPAAVFSGDNIGAGIYIRSGTGAAAGYVAKIDGSGLSINSLAADGTLTSLAGFGGVTPVSGSVCKLTFNQTTGDLSAYLDNTLIGTVIADNTYTSPQRALMGPGWYTEWGNSNTQYISVFAGTGVVADTTAPTLSAASGSATGARSATGSVTTNEANGTLYSVLTTSATQPSVAQIKAGQNHTGAAAAYSNGGVAITTTGAKTLTASSGLTPKTAYYWHSVHTDAASNDSNRISSSAFTTRGEITDTDGDNVVTNGQASVAIHGYFGASDPVVRIKSGSISQTQSDVSHNSTTITLSSISRGNLPYTDVNHQHFIEVDTDE